MLVVLVKRGGEDTQRMSILWPDEMGRNCLRDLVKLSFSFLLYFNKIIRTRTAGATSSSEYIRSENGENKIQNNFIISVHCCFVKIKKIFFGVCFPFEYYKKESTANKTKRNKVQKWHGCHYQDNDLSIWPKWRILV